MVLRAGDAQESESTMHEVDEAWTSTWMLQEISESSSNRIVQRTSWSKERMLGLRNRSIFILLSIQFQLISSLGTLLSEKLGWPMYEGDDFHSQENIQKMVRGEPLSDEDRLPWLLKLHEVIQR
ncbi:hypothetical protein INR49_015562 [Caranx melampygus]|nr:hypothetical protein INR49_015562 [Caranx melampygus]